MQTIKNKKLKEEIVYFKFLSPALVLYTLFFIVPLIGAFIYSLSDWRGIGKKVHFIGFKNFIEAFTNDDKFLMTLGNTVKFAFILVICINVLGLGLAVLLDSSIIKSSGRKNFYRSIIFMPNAISLIIVAFIWQFMFTKIYSPTVSLAGLNFLNISWFGDGKYALIAVLIATVWQSVGYYMVVYIAGLQTIDYSLIEAASIDGATFWSKFKFLTLPLIIPSIVVNVFLSIAQGFKVFEVVFLMTSGGPGNETNVMALNIYQEAFTMGRIGYASAKGIILSMIILAITYFQLKIFKSKEVKM